MNHETNQTPNGERLPARKKLAWSVGALFENLMANGINELGLQIFNIGYGVSPIMFGWAQTIPRLLDAFADPALGNWSDNTHTRWGRRKPWIFVSSVACMFLFLLLWWPSSLWSPTGIFTWFLVISIFYYLFFGMYQISYNALGMELTEDYHERTRVQSWRYLFIMLSVPILGWAYKLCFVDFFQIGCPAGAANPEVFGIRGVSLLIVGFMLLSLIGPLLFVKERHSLHTDQAPKLKLLPAMKATFGDHLYLHFLAFILFAVLGTFVTPVAKYVIIYYVCGGDKADGATVIGYYMTLGIIGSFAIIPLVNLLSARIGKPRTLLLGQGLAILVALSTWWLFTPALKYLCVITGIFYNMALGTVLILYNSVIADICDVDEIKTGKRREGVYSAVGGFMFKLVFSASTLVTGYMLVFAGFDEKLGTQPTTTLVNLRLIVMLFPAVMAAIAALLAYKFPLTERRVADYKAELDVLRRQRGEA